MPVTEASDYESLGIWTAIDHAEHPSHLTTNLAEERQLKVEAETQTSSGKAKSQTSLTVAGR